MYRAIQGGCSAAHPRAFHMSRPEGLPNYVLLLIRSCGEFEIDGKSYTVLPGHAVLFAPGTPYSYGNPEGGTRMTGFILRARRIPGCGS